MSLLNPDDLSKVVCGAWTVEPTARMCGFDFDARRISTGECFIALSSGARDGHDFVEQAMAAGASAALVERPLDIELPQLVVPDTLDAMAKMARSTRNHFGGPIVGITGSSGKTSTKEMMRLLLGRDDVHATPGNWNNLIGVPMTLFGLDGGEAKFGVIEAGINQPDEMIRLGGMIHADLTILTNIGTAHLELLKTQEGIAFEKSRLASRAKPDSPIVLPASALQHSAFEEFTSRCIVLSEVGAELEGSFRKQFVYDSSVDSARALTRISVSCAGESSAEHHFEVATTSRGIAQNAALAFLAALELGVEPSRLCERIKSWRPDELRGQFREEGGRFIYGDCYNANPDSMLDSIYAFEAASPQELARTYVIGAMNELGEEGRELHRETAHKLKLRTNDRAIFVGPDELVSAYVEGALLAGARTDQILCVENIDSLQSDIATSDRALFLKGSRSLALEKLLQPVGSVIPTLND